MNPPNNIKLGPLIAKRQPGTCQQQETYGLYWYNDWKVTWRGLGPCGNIQLVTDYEDWTGADEDDTEPLTDFGCYEWWLPTKHQKAACHGPTSGHDVFDQGGIEHALAGILASIEDATAPQKVRELKASTFDATDARWRPTQERLL